MNRPQSAIAPVGEVFGCLKVVADGMVKDYGKSGYHYYWLVECMKCGDLTEKPSFRVRYNHLSVGCSPCAYLASRGSGSPHWKGGERVPAYFVSKVKSKVHRGTRTIPFDVSLDYLDKLWAQQGAKCALTGWKISFGDNATETTASLDRINSDLGYVEGNVQFLHKAVNVAKWSLSQSDFIALCIAVANNNEGEPI